jgi:hypothetical protein
MVLRKPKPYEQHTPFFYSKSQSRFRIAGFTKELTTSTKNEYNNFTNKKYFSNGE